MRQNINTENSALKCRLFSDYCTHIWAVSKRRLSFSAVLADFNLCAFSRPIFLSLDTNKYENFFFLSSEDEDDDGGDEDEEDEWDE